MAHTGHPVMGDPVYAGGFRTKAARLSDEARAALDALGRQALHAARLGFEHPASGEELEFESALPADMQALLDALRKG
jgi:23S rRNA pseudouridine1911/1915/1917 synthase